MSPSLMIILHCLGITCLAVIATATSATPQEQSTNTWGLAERIIIHEVSPTVFSDIGGSTINILLRSHRLLGENISCLFSRKGTSDGTLQKSSASVVTRRHIFDDGEQSDFSLVVCTTPRIVPGQYMLSIESSDVVTGTYSTSESATITIIPAFSAINFEPLSGSPGAEITVYGSNFPNISLACKVGGRISGARFLSREKLVCPVPEFDHIQSLLPLPTSISVSANGQDFYDIDGSKFVVTMPPYVSDVSPLEGTALGGTLLTIRGVNLSTIDVFRYHEELSIIRPIGPVVGGNTVTEKILRISEVTPHALPTAAPHTVRVVGENFSTLPELICKLGTLLSGNKAVVIDDSTLTCFLPLVQHPGELALDLVTESGESMLAINSRGSLNFFDPSHFRIAPSFGSIDGGTIVTVTIVGISNDDDLLCRFFTSNESSSSIDVLAEPLTGNTFSCVSPNVTNIWRVDDQLHASVTLITRELGSSFGLPFPFTFKLLPTVKLISPMVGSIAGGTLVRVTSDAGIWLNSTLLTCFFGHEEGRAIWISSLVVDCISPEGYSKSSEVLLTVSDNGVDRSESQSTFSFHPDPVVTSVEPLFGIAPMDNIITFLGFGFSLQDVPMCIFHEVNGNATIYIEGTVLNETTMNCHVKSMSLDPAEYICMASNNGGLEHGRIDVKSSLVKYVSIDPPVISSLAPQSGIMSEITEVIVIGTSLSVEGNRHSTKCVLFDEAGSEMGSSLASVVNNTLATCVVRCPANNASMYYLGVSIGSFGHVHPTSLHTFWCYPKPILIDMAPRFLSVGESTLIQIYTSGILPSDCSCDFGSNRRMPVRHTVDGVECFTPVFDRPQMIVVRVGHGDTPVMDGLQVDVVDPISINDIFPKAFIAGSIVVIHGSNFIPEAIICTIGGRLGSVISASESEVACRSSPELESTFGAEVRIAFDNAPQLSASAGIVEVYTAPRISSVTPSSGLSLGGTNVIVRGTDFHVLGDPLCLFGGIPVGAIIISDNTITCVTPASDVGSVHVQVSLDSGRSLHGELPFFFFTPIILRDIYPRVVINGTKFHVLGEGLNFDLPLQCVIGGNTYSKATILSSREAICTYAAAADDSYSRLAVSMVTLNNISASVALSTEMSIVSHPYVEISSTSQLTGSAIGGESILLHMIGIVHDHTQFGPIHCDFGGKVAIATVLDENLLSCTAPPAHSPGVVSMSLLYADMPFSRNTLPFEYTTDARVFEISPSGGSYLGGTTVRLSGINLVSRGTVVCRFGGMESYGYHLDASANSTIYCITPALNHVSSETIYIKLDHYKGWLDTGVDFRFFEPISIESISPLEIGAGIDVVRVAGKGFSNTNDIHCCFGEGRNVTRQAIVLSDASLECPIPWDAIDRLYPSISIAFTANGVDFVRSHSNVTYNGMDIVLTSISPNYGPAFGGTEVDIYGVGFRANSSITCWFGDVGTRATYVAHDHVKCITSSVLIKDSEVVYQARVAVSHGHSLLAPNYSDSSLSFVFYPEQSRFNMTPTHGVSGGGTEVRFRYAVLGNVIRKLQVFGVQVRPVCRFDNITVEALIESHELVCISPPKETIVNATEAVRASVSLNGKDYVLTEKEFIYYSQPTIRSIAPEFVWLDAPINISVRGSHFLPLHQASCLVGDEVVPADVVSSSEIICLVHLLTQTYSYKNIVPVAVSLNSIDVSNFVPLICRVSIPTISSASPLFVSDVGGTLITLRGYGFEQVRRDGFVKLSGNNCVANLVISDDESASFIVPPSSGNKTAVIWIGFGSNDSFMDTGIELNFLPRLNVSSIEHRFIVDNHMTRITIFGDFDRFESYSCVVGSVKKQILEASAVHLNDLAIVCDVMIQSYDGALDLTIRRDDNNQTSNVLNLFSSTELVIDAIDPTVLSEAEALAGGAVFSFLSAREIPFGKFELLYCLFLDASGSSSLMVADVIAATEIICTAPTLVGDTEVYLTRDGMLLSNIMTISVRPTSQVLTLVPDSASSMGGTRLSVNGVGFAAFSEEPVLCQFGNEMSIAEIADDRTIFCLVPSSSVNGEVVFTLVQANNHGFASISTSDLTFLYYLPTKLVTCIPALGLANGGSMVQIHGDFLCEVECDYLVSFTSIADSTRVTHSTTVQMITSSVIEVTTPPSPMGSSGGMVLIQVSRNSGHDFSAGLYYQYTESAIIQSFYPHQVMETSCFDLTFVVGNIGFSGASCFIGLQKYLAHRDLAGGKVSCSVCLDLRVGSYQVGLLTDNNEFLLASEELSVEGNIDLLKLIPPEGPFGGGTVVLVEGSRDFSIWGCQLFCFFGARRSAAKILNSTLLQCITPASNSTKELVHIAPYYHSIVNESNSILNFRYYVQENIHYVKPRSGPDIGGTIVKVFGSGFRNRTTLSCKFGELVVDAVFISNEQIDCCSPLARDAISQGPLLKSTPLMVSNNKHDFVPAGTFVYYETPSISAVLPSKGPALTDVTLFMASSLGWFENPVCRFGDELVNATVASDSAILCMSPIQLDNTSPQVNIELSLNGVDFFVSGKTFQYSSHPLIYSISPYHGSISGYNSVLVHGRNLDFSDDLICRFGNVETVAFEVSATTIRCTAPPQTSGTVSFGITSKKSNTDIKQLYNDTLMHYTYLSPIIITSIHPTYGSISGGTVVSIQTDSLVFAEQIYCVFDGETTSIAHVTSSSDTTTVISCITPQRSISGIASLGLAQDDQPEPTFLTLFDTQFHFADEPVIIDIYPRRGPAAGGTLVTLTGKNLFATDRNTVYCKFGRFLSPAVFLSHEEVNCISPVHSPVREIQVVTITGNTTLTGSAIIEFNNRYTDLIRLDSSAETIRQKLSQLPGLEDVSVSVKSVTDTQPVISLHVTFNGFVHENQPLIAVNYLGVSGDVQVDRVQSLCCAVTLTLNGLDFHGVENEPMFVYDEKVAVIEVSPSHGSVMGGTSVILTVIGISQNSFIGQPDHQLMCVFGGDDVVRGYWVDEDRINCSTPATIVESIVAVSIRIGTVRAESSATFAFHKDPVVFSIFPPSLPAYDMVTSSIGITASFYNSSMTCFFDVSVPSVGKSGRRRSIYRQPAIIQSSSHIDCPDPPSLQSFFSNSDLLVEGSLLEISLESGADSYVIGAIPYHAVVKVTSTSPKTGPRSGGTEVIVDGQNFINSTNAMSCRFGSVSSRALYISPDKIICVAPQYPKGYGRDVVPIQVSLNGVDFSAVLDSALFEFHETLVVKHATPLVGLPMGGTVVITTLDDDAMRHRAVQDGVNTPFLISHLDPSYGPEAGGNLVTVHCVDSCFTPDHFTACHFGNKTTPARYISDVTIKCLAPKATEDFVQVDVIISVGETSSLVQQPYYYLPIQHVFVK